MPTDPYRSTSTEASLLEPDPRPRRRMRVAGLSTVLIGASIAAATPLLGFGAALLGGAISVLGISLVREAPKRAMKASCPLCGAEIGDIDAARPIERSVVRCPGCGQYVGCADGRLTALQDDFVASTPSFAIPITRARACLPPLCAECGEPDALRLVPVDVPVAADFRSTVGLVETVQVPHCDRHQEGSMGTRTGVAVRSHALWLASEAESGIAG